MAGNEQSLNLDLPLEERPIDECGTAVIYAPDGNAVHMVHKAIYAVRHRGKDGWGIGAINEFGQPMNRGWAQVNRSLEKVSAPPELEGQGSFKAAVAHTRYATSGNKKDINTIQPFTPEQSNARFLVAKNGHLEEDSLYNELAPEYAVNTIDNSGRPFTDTRVITEVLGKAQVRLSGFEPALHEVLPKLRGGNAISMTALTPDAIYGIRDRHEVRPLAIGEVKSLGAFIIASETGALNAIGADQIGEVDAGTFVRINADGIHQERWGEADLRRCIFELMYFSKPENRINGVLAADFRITAGKILAGKLQRKGIMPDISVPVLGSGEYYGRGVSAALNIPYVEGIQKNPNRKNPENDRTFITASQEIRKTAIRDKFVVVPELIQGRKIVFEEDSIVRGNTAPEIIQMLWDAGAEEVHMVVGSPPYINPCRLGIDVPNRDLLFAHKKTNEQMRKELGINSLTFLTLNEAYEAAGWLPEETCAGCFGGKYAGCSHTSKISLAAA
jgi:amidophosphoribosyltransferase